MSQQPIIHSFSRSNSQSITQSENPFFLYCANLCKFAEDRQPHYNQCAVNAHGARIAHLPTDLVALLIDQHSPIICVPHSVNHSHFAYRLAPWVTMDQVRSLTQLFTQHVRPINNQETAIPAIIPPFNTNNSSRQSSKKRKQASTLTLAQSVNNPPVIQSKMSKSVSVQPINNQIHEKPHQQTNNQSNNQSNNESHVSRTLSSPIPPPMLSALNQSITQSLSQSILQLYNLNSEERGHKLIGHSIVTVEDQLLAESKHMDLLYGEVLPSGVTRLCDSQHFNVGHANVKSVIDLGAGAGKLAMQIFLQFPNLRKVVGVELARSRVNLGWAAMRNLAQSGIHAKDIEILHNPSSNQGNNQSSHLISNYALSSNNSADVQPDLLRLTESFHVVVPVLQKCLNRVIHPSSSQSNNQPPPSRYLELRQGDLFDTFEAFDCDIVICETKFHSDMFPQLLSFLTKLAPGTRLLTYEDLDVLYANQSTSNPFVRLPGNHSNDRFYTSWAPNYGYRFHLWVKHTNKDNLIKPVEETKELKE